jgi:hypothetical protein
MATGYEEDTLDSEDTQIGALSRLPAHLAVMKMENDNIQALAMARPRNFELIKKELMSQLTAFPVLATEAIYNKPVGREDDVCADCGAVNFRDRKTGKTRDKCFECKSPNVKQGAMKYARNLSVRAAETLAEVCGYNRVRSDSSPVYRDDGKVDETQIKVEATYTDYQRGRIWQDGGMVSRVMKYKNGETGLIPIDRFLNTVVKAEKSKYVREVINRSMPAGLKAWFWEECEKITDEVLDEKTVEKIVGQFSGKGVTVEQLERLLGRTKAQGWTKQDRKTLLGVWNAIKDGETTIAEAFEIEGDKPPANPSKSVTPSELNDDANQGTAAEDIDQEPPASAISEGAWDDFQSTLEDCWSILECDQAGKMFAVDQPNDVETKNSMVEARKVAIRNSRGSRSNGGGQ